MSSQFLYEQIVIGRLPKEWEVARLGEFVDINKKSIDPSKDSQNGKFLYIDIDAVENGTGVIRNAKEILGKDAPSRARRVIYYNDVLMSTVRPYLKAFAIVPKSFHNQICSTGFAVLTCGDKIIPFYLFHTLFTKSVINQCKKMMVGGQYPALSTSQVGKIRIPIPPLPEQKKIADVLSTVDQGIEKVGEAIKKTQRLKNGLMQKLLTKGIGHKEFKETEIGRIPREWDVMKLGEIANVRYGLGQPPALETNGIPMIRATNVKRGRIVREGLIFINPGAVPNSRDPFLSVGDILVVRSGAYTGDVALVTKEWEGAIAGYDLIVTPSGTIDSQFLTYYLLSPPVQKRHFVGLKVRSAQPHLNSSQVEETPIPLPPLQEQQRIAEILSTVDERLESLRNRKEKLGRIKKGLMNDLLTGKVRVTKLIEREVQDSSSLRLE